MHTTIAATKPTWAGRVPQLKPGTYADGLPLHELHYLCCKLMLRPNHFPSRESLFDFEKVLKAPAKRERSHVHGGGFRRRADSDPRSPVRGYGGLPALQQRASSCAAGFPTRTASRSGDPEIVFKFRHPDLQTAAETDVRPHILGDHRVKFKCQALPLKGRARRHPPALLAQRAVSALARRRERVLSMGTMARIFPVLESHQEGSGRAGHAGQQHDHRGSAPGHRHARLRRRA